MIKKQLWKQEIKFHLWLQVILAIFITGASYVHLPFGSTKGNFVYLAHFILLHFSLFGFLYFFSLLFGVFFKYIFQILFVIIASLAFWVYTQDLTIGVGMMQAIIETKPDVVLEVLSFPFISYVILAFFAVYIFFKKVKDLRVSNWKSPMIIFALLGVITFFVVEDYKFDAFKNRLPYNVYFNTIKYFDKPKVELKKLTEKPFTNRDSLQIILVVGESARADHLQLNGYSRATTPLLSKRENIVSFKNVYTPFTYTGYSLPQILTNKSIKDSNNKKFYSLFSVLEKANFKTTWIGNQSLESSYKDIIYSNQTKTIIDEYHSFLSFKKAKDLVLLDYLDFNDDKSKNEIVTLHMIGSHWYYKSRITKEFEVFKPTIESKYLGSLKKKELINAYDNTIVYLDFFLNTLIGKLEKSSKKTILIYLSDHGETLGEDGMWLHAQDHEASKNPAMLIWYSKEFRKAYPKKIDNMIAKQQDSITTDFLFHSILDVVDLEDFNYAKEKSIFQSK